MGAERLGAQAPLTERVRAFFGLPLPEEHRRRLEVFLAECAGVAPAFRWSDPRNLHLTVRFIGSVERDVVERIASRLELDAGAPFEVRLGGVGAFKRGRTTARVVWLGVREGGQPLRALAGRVEALCRDAGLEPGCFATRPHVHKDAPQSSLHPSPPRT